MAVLAHESSYPSLEPNVAHKIIWYGLQHVVGSLTVLAHSYLLMGQECWALYFEEMLLLEASTKIAPKSCMGQGKRQTHSFPILWNNSPSIFPQYIEFQPYSSFQKYLKIIFFPKSIPPLVQISIVFCFPNPFSKIHSPSFISDVFKFINFPALSNVTDIQYGSCAEMFGDPCTSSVELIRLGSP